ncbi:MAG: hypothetical protein HN667_07620 [Chloroflexi bacterium]|jgi:hypothetical protein|nr:hypothetical protein [Chloroflexota bacterium]
MTSEVQKVGRKPKLTNETTGLVVESIEAGAFDYVAAEAAGISPSTYYDWMARGRNGEPEFLEFSERVRQARAQARLNAESRVFKSDPKSWLRYGPGKDRPSMPGWTEREIKSDEKPRLDVLIHQITEIVDAQGIDPDYLPDQVLLSMIAQERLMDEKEDAKEAAERAEERRQLFDKLKR